jgi:hypothetical protein
VEDAYGTPIQRESDKLFTLFQKINAPGDDDLLNNSGFDSLWTALTFAAEKLGYSDSTREEYQSALRETAHYGQAVVAVLTRYKPRQQEDNRELIRQRDVAIRQLNALISRCQSAVTMKSAGRPVNKLRSR